MPLCSKCRVSIAPGRQSPASHCPVNPDLPVEDVISENRNFDDQHHSAESRSQETAPVGVQREEKAFSQSEARANLVAKFIAGHRAQLIRQGSIAATWRRRAGKRVGPYYLLVVSDDAGRRRSVYLGVEGPLVAAARVKLARLQDLIRENLCHPWFSCSVCLHAPADRVFTTDFRDYTERKQ